MFTRAGFSMRIKTVCVALIWRRGSKWRMARPSYLARFLGSGDYAWVSRHGVSWPERVIIWNWIQLPFADQYGPKSALLQ